MTVLLPSANTAVERLIAVQSNRPGSVHRKLLDESNPGGKPVNVARMLTQLGSEAAEPYLAGFLGGTTGEIVRNGLRRERLEGCWVSTSSQTRLNEVLVDLTDADGATVYNAQGDYVTPSEVSELDGIIVSKMERCKALVCTGSIAEGVPFGQYSRWIALARVHGALSLVDTTGAALHAAAQSGPSIVKVNREELAAAGGANMVDSWRAAGVGSVIVTNGAKATLAVTPTGSYRVTPPHIAAVNPVGSGDAFTAGLIDSILNHGDDWPRHLRHAAACGASNARDIRAALHCPLEVESLRDQVDVKPLGEVDTTKALNNLDPVNA